MAGRNEWQVNAKMVQQETETRGSTLACRRLGEQTVVSSKNRNPGGKRQEQGRGKPENCSCRTGQIETVEHLIVECSNYERQRGELVAGVVMVIGREKWARRLEEENGAICSVGAVWGQKGNRKKNGEAGKSVLSITNCPIHSYADDSTLHYSTSFNRRPSQQELHDSRLEAAERLTSELTIISDWGKRNLVSFNASKTQFLHLSTRHNLRNTYPLFFDNTQLSPSSTLNILSLSLTQNLNWKLHILSLTKSASSRLGVLYCLRQFFSPAQLLSIYKGIVRPRMEYASHVWGGSTHTALLDRVESKALRLISSPPLTDSLLPLNFCRHVTSLSIIYRYFHADCFSELANCMPPPLPQPRCTRLSSHAHPYTVQTPYARVNQHLHSFIPHAGKLWNNLPSSVFPPAYDLNSFKRRVSGHLSSRN
ncbi:uncharacterized protein LOC126999291 [Eriocheir sinensis]|uniref:uncharacterized protein LOC126999291 n=1 Tax=Eriocheir sinensis TaxID=95602 RepID=UPI0021C719EE|nr:uncharacterized protein LOC126999291 [Eriocheir sinensis]